MPIVAETGIISEHHLLDRVAGTAPLFYTKGGFIIMTGSTGQSVFHICHGVALGGHSGTYESIMAIAAGQNGTVTCVTEGDIPCILELETDIGHRTGVTFVTVRCNGKSVCPVMAGSARQTFLHLRHCVAYATDASCKK